jgi:hypothetical protein
VAVLHQIYAKVIAGLEPAAHERIERALGWSSDDSAGSHGGATGATTWNQPETAGQRRTGHDHNRGEFPQVRGGRWLIREGAPGAIRTHTGRVLNPLPLPVGLRGLGA